MNQTHSKKFHCTYLLHYYPFDTQVRQSTWEESKVMGIFQVCLVHLQLEQFSRKSVEIDPGTIEMLSPIELTQYFIKVKTYFIIF